MLEASGQEVLRQYGLLAFTLPFLPSLVAAGVAQVIVPAPLRGRMPWMSATCVLICFAFVAALLPLLESSLPASLLRWEAAFILCLPVVAILALAAYLRGSSAVPTPA
jgi:hypothetical protein